MGDSGWFLVGAILLVLGLAAGWWRWWRGAETARPRWLAQAVVIVASVGALIGAPFWWLDLPASFAWDLPPAASRLLAVAALAFALAGVMALEKAERGGIDLVTALVAVYLVPLVAAAVAFHLDRFDMAAPVSWGFFVAAAGLGCAALVAVRNHTPARRAMPSVDPFVPAMMMLGGIALGIWGAAMFVYPHAPFRALFPWPRDPLTARLMAVMLLSAAAALLFGRRERWQAEIALAFVSAYGIGAVGVCIAASCSAGGGLPPLYAATLGSFGLLSAFLWWALRHPAMVTGGRRQP